MSGSVRRYYEEDHHRLDDLYKEFQTHRSRNFSRAKEALSRFRSGLEQHMAWEEAILFSEFDARVRDPERSVTDQLLSEHGEILSVLDRLEAKLAEPETDTKPEEARLMKALAEHNRAEETGLYAELDRLLTNQERDEVFKKMKESAWNEDRPSGG